MTAGFVSQSVSMVFSVSNKINAQFQCRHLRQDRRQRVHITGGITAELHRRTAKTANIGIAISAEEVRVPTQSSTNDETSEPLQKNLNFS